MKAELPLVVKDQRVEELVLELELELELLKRQSVSVFDELAGSGGNGSYLLLSWES